MAGAALLLGYGSLIGLPPRTPTGPLPSGSTLEPVLVPAQGSVHGPSGSDHPGPGRDGADGRGQAAAPSAGQRIRADSGRPGGDLPERPDEAYQELLDQVFGPGRVRRAPEAEASRLASNPGAEAEEIAPERREQRRWSAAGGIATDSVALVAAQRDGRRPVTEKDHYEKFLALGEEDVQALVEHADGVLRGNGENCEKVAMLRALYESDRSSALDHFVRAIASLPDRPQAEGVSVPEFAVSFLAKRVGDPAVRALVERIAWGGYLDVSTDLRRRAQEALHAVATEADLRRHAAYAEQQRDLARISELP